MSDPASTSADRTRPLGSRLRGLFNEQVVQRTPLEVEWLKDERQFKGVYEGDDIKRFKERDNCSKEYLRVTSQKVKTLDARLADLDSGTGKKNWTIRPDEDVDDVEVMGTDDERDDPQEQAADDQHEAVGDQSAAKAERMDRTIWGQLQHAKYGKLKRLVAHSGHKFGTGILKGPMVNRRQVKRWGLTKSTQRVGTSGSGDTAGPGSQSVPSETDATWQVQTSEQDEPAWTAVRIWDYYPEMEGWDLENTEFCFERHMFHKSDLLGLASRSNFLGKVITDFVTAHPDGQNSYMSWETELDAIGRYTSAYALIKRRRYEVIEYWGPVSVDELQSIGKDLPEDLAGQVEAHVWFMAGDGTVIAADINPIPKRERPYAFYTPFPEEGHLFGESLPSLMRDPQKLQNATLRMMADNAASAVLPQVEIDISRVPTAKNITAMPPGRMWAVQPDPYGNNSRAINFSDFPNHTQMYLMMLQYLGVKTDEISGIPAYQAGNNPGTGAGRTSSGLSMLMGAAGLLLKNQLYAWDDFQSRVIMLAYDWNMAFNPDQTIKGNFKVHVVGSMSLAMREVRAQQLRDFRLSVSSNQQTAQYIKTRELLWAEAEENEIDPHKFIKSKIEMAQETAKLNQDTQAKLNDPMRKLMATLGMEAQAADIAVKMSTAAMNNAKAGQVNEQQFQDEMAALLQDAATLAQGQAVATPPPAQPGQQPGAPPAPGVPAPSAAAPGQGGPTVPAPAPTGPQQQPNMAKGGTAPLPEKESDMKQFLHTLLTDSQNPRTYV